MGKGLFGVGPEGDTPLMIMLLSSHSPSLNLPALTQGPNQVPDREILTRSDTIFILVKGWIKLDPIVKV